MNTLLVYRCVSQRDDVGESTRDRREAVSFWKRLGTLAPDARDKLAAFWKRGHPHDALDSFWKRGVPAAGRRVQAFWKRFVELADNDEDLAAMLAEMRAAGGPAHAAEKKHFFAGRQQQQRRAKETSARRPEFNPTGW